MPDSYKKQIDIPPMLTDENKFQVDGNFDKLDEDGKVLFNWLFEFIERNRDAMFATDLFKLEGFTNEQIKTVYKILGAGQFNISITAAQFISGFYKYE